MWQMHRAPTPLGVSLVSGDQLKEGAAMARSSGARARPTAGQMRVQVRGPIGDGDFLHSETWWVSHPFQRKIGVCGVLRWR
jgi:hypothetical protein